MVHILEIMTSALPVMPIARAVNALILDIHMRSHLEILKKFGWLHEFKSVGD